jgi:hypothetical protein
MMIRIWRMMHITGGCGGAKNITVCRGRILQAVEQGPFPQLEKICKEV